MGTTFCREYILTRFQAARKSLQNSIGPMAAKKLRPFQDMESSVCINDILEHGNKTVNEKLSEKSGGHVPEEHWFSLIRRYVWTVDSYPRLCSCLSQTTSVVMTVTYGKRAHKIVGNPRLCVP